MFNGELGRVKLYYNTLYLVIFRNAEYCEHCYLMYGNKGLEAHVDNNHTIGISLLCMNKNNNNNSSIIKKWIIIETEYIKKLFGNKSK